MKKRIVAITIMCSMLLALFVVMPPADASASTENPIVLVSSTINNQNPVAGATVDLTLVFTNISNVPVSDIWVTLSGFGSGLSLASGEFTRRLDTISGNPLYPLGPLPADSPLNLGQQGVVIFPITVAGSVDGPMTLNIDISYIVGGNEMIDDFSAAVNIVRPLPPEPPPPPEPEIPPPPPPQLPPSVPRIIISQHLISTDTVYVGQPFELTVTLLNTSRNMNVRNMEVVFSDAGGTFFPVVGVNSFFIERLNAQETAEITIQLVARPPANSDRTSHAITVEIAYEDMRNNPYSTSPSINIPVLTEIRIGADNVNFEDNGNGTGFLMFQVINRGLAPLNNVNLRIEGNLAAMEGNFYVGTMNPGDVEFFEDDIMVFEFGEVTGEIIIEFEDATGIMGEVRIPISAFISEPFFPDPPDWGDGGRFPPGEDIWIDEQPAGMAWWIWALIIGGGVIVVGGVTFLIIRRVRRKKQEAEDFDEE